MRWWFDFIALKWMAFRDILAVLLGNVLKSLLLFAFGWSMGYYVVLPAVRSASIPPLVLRLIPYASGVVFGSLPWLIPFLPVLPRKPLE